MTRGLKRVQLGLFLTPNTSEMPIWGRRHIPLFSLHLCWTGLSLRCDFLCTVPPEPCKFIPSQLRLVSALALFAQWTSRHCSASSSKLVCFFSILPTTFHSLPSLYSASYHISLIPNRRPSSLFCPNQGAASTHKPGSLSPSPRSPLIWKYTL